MASPPPAVGAPAGRTARRKCIGRFNLNYLNAPFYSRFCHTTSLLKISAWDAGKNYKALSCNYKGLGKNYKGLRKNYPALSFHQIPGFFPPTRPIKRRSRRGMCPACSVCTTKLLHFSAKSKSVFLRFNIWERTGLLRGGRSVRMAQFGRGSALSEARLFPARPCGRDFDGCVGPMQAPCLPLKAGL